MDISGDLNALFETYARLLAEGDVDHLARLFAYPALVVAPRNRLVVADAGQTRAHLSEALAHYAGQGIVSCHPTVLWNDRPARGVAVAYVNFSNHDRDGTEVSQERYAYQLVQVDGWWKIAVVTPLLA